MRKSWLMCVLLGTLAWGQAAPSAPPPAAAGRIPASAMADPRAAAPDTAASVPDDAAVITVTGVCAEQTANNAAQAQSVPAIDCKTVITKAQFETLANNLAPNITPQQKKQLAGLLPRWIAMSDQATKKGLNKTPQFEDKLKIARMQILTTEAAARHLEGGGEDSARRKSKNTTKNMPIPSNNSMWTGCLCHAPSSRRPRPRKKRTTPEGQESERRGQEGQRSRGKGEGRQSRTGDDQAGREPASAGRGRRRLRKVAEGGV